MKPEDKKIAQCYIRQMRKELENFSFSLDEMTKYLDAPEGFSDMVYRNSGEAISSHAKELLKVRKYFNIAFRGLQNCLTCTED